MKTAEEFALMLNGRKYKDEITAEEIKEASDSNLVVVMGKSDDTTVLCGAIDAQVNTTDGGEIYLTPQGVFEECPCNCIYSQRAKKNAKILKAIWCKGPYVWHYEINVPHYTFEIIDNQPAENLKFCQGIIFNLKELNQLGVYNEKI